MIDEVYRIHGTLLNNKKSKAYQAPQMEAIGDNKVDNLVVELRRVTEVEVAMFVATILTRAVKSFSQSYSTPLYEEFRNTFKDLIARYQVMDGNEQGDLFVKIENMMKDIFVQKYAALGPESAEVAGSQYAAEMVKAIKNESVMANVDLYPTKSWY